MSKINFKQEVSNEFDKMIEECMWRPDEVTVNFGVGNIKDFILDSLDTQKKKILEALPKSQKVLDTDPRIVVAIKSTRSEAISEVRHIIENI